MPSRRSSTPTPGGPRRRRSKASSSDENQQELFTPAMAQQIQAALVASQAGAPPRGDVPIAPAGPAIVRGSASGADDALPEAGREEGPDDSASKATPMGEVSQAAAARSAKAAGEPSNCALPEANAEGEVLPARMLNEFVYCPRLFYYEHVQGVFVENADTVRGTSIHKRVDKGNGAMPSAKNGGKSDAKEGGAERGEAKGGESQAKPAKAEDESPEEIHARSVMLGSDRLGVVAKMDLVEVALDADGAAVGVEPVDYKAGSPREGADGEIEIWDTDRMQLGLQCLVLRDNGYRCDAGLIYYRGTKQRVRLELTAALEAWVVDRIAAARDTAAGPIPPPLIDSPKCARCSLAPVCLPDETHMLSVPTAEFYPNEDIGVSSGGTEQGRNGGESGEGPRRLIAARDERRALYLNTQGFRVGCSDAVLKVKEKDRVVEEVRMMDLCHVALFGNIQVTTQAVQRLCDGDVPLTWFSMGGWFYGITRGHSLKNVQVRIAQFRGADDPAVCLRLARQFVRGKIHNHRVLFMRNHASPAEAVKLRLGKAREDALAAESLEELLGVEGAAAAVYFEQFPGLLRDPEEDELEGVLTPESQREKEPGFTFDFTTRNRRPPTDPVNALLSLAYSILAKECTLAAYAMGLDPYVGFYHQPRHGRPALALDLMEEFRPLIAESAVLTAINNRFVTREDFVSAGKAVNLSPAGRKQFFQCFEQRLNSLITHPVFDYKVSYRRAIELQFRILARVLTGEIPEYVPFMTR